MKRLWNTFLNDVRLQWRHGFYMATAVILALFALILAQLSAEDLSYLLPVVIVNNIIVNGFYFVAGLVLLEKGEGSIEAQVVTPLRAGEYLTAKVASLAVLSLVENGLLSALLMGASMHAGWLLIGMVTGTAFFTLSGFLSVVRYETINEYLLPSILIVCALTLPLLSYFGIGNSELLATALYLHPLQAVLLALRAAAGAPLSGAQIAYVVVYSILSTVVVLHVARITYARFVRQTTLGRARRPA